MRASLFAVGCIAVLSSGAIAEEPRRELGPHVHGQGSLNVAIEGNRVVMEFHAPGADITGTEAKAETPEAKAVLAAAIAVLEKPLELFVLPAAAGCKAVSAKAEVAADDDDDDDHAPAVDAGTSGAAPQPPSGAAADAKPAGHDAGHDHEHDHGHEHSEMKASYEITCAAPDKATSLQFDYFRAFPRAQKMTVQVITAKGSSQLEATTAAPRVEFGGLM